MSTSPSTKERILASAMRLLDTGGPGAVTLRAVGDAAGISQSAPYRHYEDKRALLTAIVRANLGYFTTAVENAQRDSSPFGSLDQLIRAYFDFARRFPVRYRFLLETGREHSPLGEEVRRVMREVTSLVQAAQDAGEIRHGDPEQISALIYGVAYGVSDQARHDLPPSGAQNALPRGAAADLAPLLMDLLATTPARD
jgi:AcrR family transcriptional regulator